MLENGQSPTGISNIAEGNGLVKFLSDTLGVYNRVGHYKYSVDSGVISGIC